MNLDDLKKSEPPPMAAPGKGFPSLFLSPSPFFSPEENPATIEKLIVKIREEMRR